MSTEDNNLRRAMVLLYDFNFTVNDLMRLWSSFGPWKRGPGVERIR